jgi:hypothetical protein
MVKRRFLQVRFDRFRFPSFRIWARELLLVAAVTSGTFLEVLAIQVPHTDTVDVGHPCDQCRIVVKHLIALGGPNVSIEVSGPAEQVQMDSRGRFVLVPSPATRLARFSSDGSDGQFIGGPDDGQPDYHSVHRFFIDANDTIFVIDGGLRRMSVVGPNDTIARTFPLPLTLSAAYTPFRLPGGDLLLGGIFPTPERIGFPLHRVSPLGKVLNSFGVHEPLFDWRNEWDAHRVMAFDGRLVWASRRFRYEIEAWDPLSGEPEGILRRDASWFPPRPTIFQPGGVGNLPLLAGLQFDGSGMLWVAVTVAPKETIIEVIDPAENRLVTRSSVPVYAMGFAGPGLLYSPGEDAQGHQFWDIWRLEFVGR